MRGAEKRRSHFALYPDKTPQDNNPPDNTPPDKTTVGQKPARTSTCPSLEVSWFCFIMDVIVCTLLSVSWISPLDNMPTMAIVIGRQRQSARSSRRDQTQLYHTQSCSICSIFWTKPYIVYSVFKVHCLQTIFVYRCALFIIYLLSSLDLDCI
jgi:hypothetical protein